MGKFKRREWIKASALTALGIAGLGYGHTSGANILETSHLVSSRSLHLSGKNAPEFARLSSNENPFGPSKKAKKALFEAVEDSFLYPGKYRQQLEKLIAEKEGVTTDHILLGAGSSELLDAGARVFSVNGGKILSADPTYASLIRSAQSYGAEWTKVPLDKEHDQDLETKEGMVDMEMFANAFDQIV